MKLVLSIDSKNDCSVMWCEYRPDWDLLNSSFLVNQLVVNRNAMIYFNPFHRKKINL